MRIDQDPALSSFGIQQPGAVPGPVTHRQRLIDEASAVVAIDGSTPLQPHSDALAAIHRRLQAGQGTGSRRLRVAAWSGWICAAAAGILAWHSGRHPADTGTRQADRPAPAVAAIQPAPSENKAETEQSATRQLRMSQEIEALRQQIKLLGERDAERMTVAHGVSWPVIMHMTRPGTDADASAVDLMLASLIGDAGNGAIENEPGQDLPKSPAPTPDGTLEPTAIPIYDPARDKGQIILVNLPAPAAAEAYHLWVKYDEAARPILVGTLPAEVDPVSSTMDFRLGTTGVVPDNFWITRDARQAPEPPSSANIILQGPELR